jgi:hypothetical protein
MKIMAWRNNENNGNNEIMAKMASKRNMAKA